MNSSGERAEDEPRVIPDKCRHYARFAAHLDRVHFDMIYWVLFIVVIFMLFAASWRYGRSIDAVANEEAGSPAHKRKMKQTMMICSVYAVISVVAVVMEVFALMALQFCEGEDLMALYWSTWTVMQIGSLIAIFGVLLAVFHTIRGRKHPPWALALGTPVLVVAGLGHIIQGAVHKRVKSVRGRCPSRGRSLESVELARSTSATICAEDSEKDDDSHTYRAKLIGYTPDGATILQFRQSSTPLSPLLSQSAQARIIGTNTEGQVIVALRKESGGAAAVADGDNAATAPRLPVLQPGARRSSVSIKIEEPLARRDAPGGWLSPPPPSSSSPTVVAGGSGSPGSAAGTLTPPVGGSPTAVAGVVGGTDGRGCGT